MEIQCGNCNQTLEIEDQYANMAFDCPTCGANNVPEIETPVNNFVQNNDTNPCPMCGEDIKKIAKICKHCGEILDHKLKKQKVNSNNTLQLQPKSRLAYILLAIFFGGLGVHNFYAGYILTGLIQLFLCCTVVGAIVVLFWLVCDILFTTKDGHGIKFA